MVFSNQKNFRPVPVCLLLMTLVPSVVLAQHNAVIGGTKTPNVFAAQVQRDLAEVLRNPVDDQPVVLRGRLQQRLKGDKYLFVSGSVSIRVEIDAEAQPPIPVTPQTLVEIEGEVEKDFLESPEVDVHRITVLP